MFTAASAAARRLLIAGTFAISALAPMIASVAAPSGLPAHLASCPTGEEGDLYTDTCTPYLVPNSPAAPPAPVSAPSNSCPPGVTGAECGGSTGNQAGPAEPQMPGQIAPQGPEEELQDVSTPDY